MIIRRTVRTSGWHRCLKGLLPVILLLMMRNSPAVACLPNGVACNCAMNPTCRTCLPPPPPPPPVCDCGAPAAVAASPQCPPCPAPASFSNDVNSFNYQAPANYQPPNTELFPSFHSGSAENYVAPPPPVPSAPLASPPPSYSMSGPGFIEVPPPPPSAPTYPASYNPAPSPAIVPTYNQPSGNYLQPPQESYRLAHSHHDQYQFPPQSAAPPAPQPSPYPPPVPAPPPPPTGSYQAQPPSPSAQPYAGGAQSGGSSFKLYVEPHPQHPLSPPPTDPPEPEAPTNVAYSPLPEVSTAATYFASTETSHHGASPPSARPVATPSSYQVPTTAAYTVTSPYVEEHSSEEHHSVEPYHTFTNQICTGVSLGRSMEPSMSAIAEKCSIVSCGAANVRTLSGSGYEATYLKDAGSRRERQGYDCMMMVSSDGKSGSGFVRSHAEYHKESINNLARRRSPVEFRPTKFRFATIEPKGSYV